MVPTLVPIPFSAAADIILLRQAELGIRSARLKLDGQFAPRGAVDFSDDDGEPSVPSFREQHAMCAGLHTAIFMLTSSGCRTKQMYAVRRARIALAGAYMIVDRL